MKTKIAITLITVSSLIIAACGNKNAAESKEAKEEILVKTASIELKEFSAPIVSSGIITSNKETKLSFKIGGIVNQTLFEEGDMVAKGQLLATLNQTEILAQVTQAQNAFDKAKRDFDRVSNLYNDSAATLEQYQNAKTGFEVSKQSLSIAKFNQQYASVYANQTGRIIKKMANEGELVTPGSTVYMINSTAENDWIVRIGVSDKDWARLKQSDKASITVDAYPGRVLNAQITQIAEASDAYTGTFEVELKINAPQVKLANGLIAKVEIKPTQSDKVYLVPIEALLDATENTATVYSLASDGSAVKHTVKIAYIINNKAAVTDGLTNITNVITDGASYISKDTKIKLVQ